MVGVGRLVSTDSLLSPACHIIRNHSMSKTLHSPSGPPIVAQAPCRADLAGGTIDLWPLYLFHPGAMTLNFAVNILTTCRVTPLKGKQIHLALARHK